MEKTICISILLQNTATVTVANIQDMRSYIATKLPNAKVTWCPDNVFAFPGNKDAENALVASYLAAGDDLAMGDGFPAVNYPDLAQFQAHVDEFWSVSQTRYWRTPKVATAWHYPAAYIAYLATKGVRTVTGTVWSQTNVDRFQGEGTRLFPYYPSTTNASVPGKTPATTIDVVSCNSLSPDPLGCRVLTGDSRWTLHPADPDTSSSATQIHILEQAKLTPYPYPLFVYPEVDWLYWNPTTMLLRFKETIDALAARPEISVITLGEYGEAFRKRNPDNHHADGMAFQGSGLVFGNSESDDNLKQYWYEDADCSVCLQKDLTTQAVTVEACVHYVEGTPESDGYFDFEGTKYRDYSNRTGKSYKFDNGAPRTNVRAHLEARARAFFGL